MNKLCKTNGELEAEISQAMIRLEKEFTGRGPIETKTYIIDDMVLVRLKGVLTQTEMTLAESSQPLGRFLVKQMRQELLDQGRPKLEGLIREILQVDVRSFHTDISTKTGERIIVLSLSEKPRLGPDEKSCSAPSDERANGRYALSKK